MSHISINIQTNLIAPLIGKSHFNKAVDSFIKILNINTNNTTNMYGETNHLDSFLDTYIEKLHIQHENVKDVRRALDSSRLEGLSLRRLEKLKKHIICSFGKKHEKTIINKYKENYKLNEMQDIKKFCSKTIFKCKHFDIVINGSPDYIALLENQTEHTIIEIKNRIHSLSTSLKECDYIQLQIYLNLFDIQNGKLIEGLIADKNDIQLNIFDVQKNEQEYKDICNKLVLPSILLYKLITNKDMRAYFYSLDKIEKNNYISNNLEIINKLLHDTDIN